MMAASATKRKRRGYAEKFLLYTYKVAPCIKRCHHDWAKCPAAHPGETALRRDVRLYTYAPVACSYAKQGEVCPRGDACPCAHNMYEYWLHPKRYSTQLCQDGPSCNRAVCFYAHTLEELRPLHPTLPPPEPLWSAGAWGVVREPPAPPPRSRHMHLQLLKQEYDQDLWLAQQALMIFMEDQDHQQRQPYFEAPAAPAAASDTTAPPQLVSYNTDVADSRCESLVPSTPLTVVSHSPAVPAPDVQQQQGMMPPASYWVVQNNTSQLLPSAADSSLQYQLQPSGAPGLLVPAAAPNTVNQLPVTTLIQPQQQQQRPVQYVITGGSQMSTAQVTGQPLAASLTTNDNMVVAATPAQVQQQLQSPTVLQQLVAAPVSNAAVDTAYNSTAAVVQAPISLAPVSNTPVDTAYNSTAAVVQAPMFLAPVNTTVSNTSLVNTAPFSVAANSSAVINNTPVNLVMADTAAASTAPVNTALTAAMLGLSLAPSTPTLGETAAAAAAPCYLPGLQLDSAWTAGGATAAAGCDSLGGGQVIGDVTTGQGVWSF